MMRRMTAMLLAVMLSLSAFPVKVAAAEMQEGAQASQAGETAQGTQASQAGETAQGAQASQAEETAQIAGEETEQQVEEETDHIEETDGQSDHSTDSTESVASDSVDNSISDSTESVVSVRNSSAIAAASADQEVSLLSNGSSLSGSCGEGVYYELTEDGVLYITGFGATYDYTEENAANEKLPPWWEERASITRIEVGEGVTAVGKRAFAYCTKAESVVLPDSLDSIGDMAFLSCTALKQVQMPDTLSNLGSFAFGSAFRLTDIRIPSGISTIGVFTFQGCSGLTEVEIPGTITTIQNNAFQGCRNLAAVTIPDSVTYIGSYAFASCPALTKAYYTGTKEDWANVTVESNNTALTDVLTYRQELVLQENPEPASGVVGEKKCFAVAALGDGLTYQWQYAETGSSIWKNSPLAGNKQSELTVPVTAGRNGMRYRCVVQDKYGSEATSREVALTVLPEFSIQPAPASGKIGERVVFCVKASGAKLQYQWQYAAAGSETWKNSVLSGNKKASMTVPVTAGRNGMRYRCQITDANGETLISGEAALTVLSEITEQPVSVTAKIGSTAVFSVKASGAKLKYQWQYAQAGSDDWKNSPLATRKKASLEVPVTAGRNGMSYRCLITDANGVQFTSNEAQLFAEK